MQPRPVYIELSIAYIFFVSRPVYSALSESRIECGIDCGIGASYV